MLQNYRIEMIEGTEPNVHNKQSTPHDVKRLNQSFTALKGAVYASLRNLEMNSDRNLSEACRMLCQKIGLSVKLPAELDSIVMTMTRVNRGDWGTLVSTDLAEVRKRCDHLAHHFTTNFRKFKDDLANKEITAKERAKEADDTPRKLYDSAIQKISLMARRRGQTGRVSGVWSPQIDVFLRELKVDEATRKNVRTLWAHSDERFLVKEQLKELKKISSLVSVVLDNKVKEVLDAFPKHYKPPKESKHIFNQ